ncbi:MAG: phage holin family protein [Pseudomonadota bacterium]
MHPATPHPILRFLAFWGVNTLSLWVADQIFDGVRFDDVGTLFASGLLLGVINTFLKPVLLILTLPATILTLGLMLPILNGLLLLLVAWLVPGFHVQGFWYGVLVALFVSLFSVFLNTLLGPYGGRHPARVTATVHVGGRGRTYEAGTGRTYDAGRGRTYDAEEVREIEDRRD